MDFSADPELDSLAAEAAKLAADFDDDYWSKKARAHEFPWEYYRAVAEGGWLGIVIPEEYGGAGLGVLHAATLLNTVASCGGAMSAASTLHISIFGMGPVIHHGTEEYSHTELDAADLLWKYAAWAYDHGERGGGPANTAKIRAAEACFTACDRALQTFGGMGYAVEMQVERYWREARLMRLAPISQEMATNYIAEHVLGLPRSY